MRILYVATRNEHKVIEIRACLDGLAVRLESLPQSAPEVVEDGETFVANAVKKAESAAAHTGEWAIADDSGIEVDALGGAPGVRSARYAGVEDGGADDANNRLLLENLKDVADDGRTGRFRCTIAPRRNACSTCGRSTGAGSRAGVCCSYPCG